MPLEEFKKEVSTWERKDVKKTLRTLKNCNDLMELIDLFDKEKFDIIEEHLGRKFFMHACKGLDSWKHYFKWMSLTMDEKAYP